ncbi:type II toxin-antitoxin system HicA family toxin [Candidatus Acetothermia bacterium]|nr:type II toxin-antitoxin system HicA family toxin [Candidatus Acetothermia bacterium]MBI3459995.1 type II toxin-antitoxin system HicA family toxin [Candidatus Acetothermia bacterium]MBI3659397.1 type II toxin-antitoxin system HicA family toxin [Candidatus Acetothermia bacterium]
MPVYTYRQVRSVLRKLGFDLVRSRKHETWEKILEDGSVLQVRLSHKGGRDVPPGTFAEILRQMGISRETFEKLA